MKKLIHFVTLACALTIGTKSFSTIIVVNNNFSNPGQYNNLQTAIDAAFDGDTIHIEPSPYCYSCGEVYLTKSLTLMGVGFNPAYGNANIALLGQLRMSGTACSVGATIIGLKTGLIAMACGQPSYNFVARNCQIESFGSTYESNCFSAVGWYNTIIENCLVGNFSNSWGGDNVIARNCVFAGSSFNFGAINNLVVQHNLFVFNLTDINQTGISANGALFENNVFYRVGPRMGNGAPITNSTFNNNLAYQTLNDALVGGTNTGENNISGQDPLFVNYVDGTVYNSSYNFRLTDVSPGNNTATDGSDIGPYGGGFTFSETGEFNELPVIREMAIENSTVPSQGTIQVHVKVTSFTTDNP